MAKKESLCRKIRAKWCRNSACPPNHYIVDKVDGERIKEKDLIWSIFSREWCKSVRVDWGYLVKSYAGSIARPVSKPGTEEIAQLRDWCTKKGLDDIRFGSGISLSQCLLHDHWHGILDGDRNKEVGMFLQQFRMDTRLGS